MLLLLLLRYTDQITWRFCNIINAIISGNWSKFRLDICVSSRHETVDCSYQGWTKASLRFCETSNFGYLWNSSRFHFRPLLFPISNVKYPTNSSPILEAKLTPSRVSLCKEYRSFIVFQSNDRKSYRQLENEECRNWALEAQKSNFG